MTILKKCKKKKLLIDIQMKLMTMIFLIFLFTANDLHSEETKESDTDKRNFISIYPIGLLIERTFFPKVNLGLGWNQIQIERRNTDRNQAFRSANLEYNNYPYVENRYGFYPSPDKYIFIKYFPFQLINLYFALNFGKTYKRTELHEEIIGISISPNGFTDYLKSQKIYNASNFSSFTTGYRFDFGEYFFVGLEYQVGVAFNSAPTTKPLLILQVTEKYPLSQFNSFVTNKKIYENDYNKNEIFGFGYLFAGVRF
jgi:hypothetical protein